VVEIDGNRLILENYVGRLLGPGELRARVRAQEPKTWIAWAEFSTGSRDHWIASGYKRPRQPRVWASVDVNPKLPLLHEAFNRMGLSVGLFAVPVACWPPRPLNGWMCSGGSLYSARVWPESLQEHVIQPRPLWGTTWEDLQAAREAPFDDPRLQAARHDMGQKALGILNAELHGALALCCESPVDVLLWYVSMTDCIQHVLAHDALVMERVYAWVRMALAVWAESQAPEQIVVVSDHGMREVKPEQVAKGGRAMWHTGAHRDEGCLVYRDHTPFARALGEPRTVEMRDLFGVLTTAVGEVAEPPVDEEAEAVLERLRDLGYEE